MTFNHLSTLSRRYCLLLALVATLAGYLFEQSQDELARMLFLVTAVISLIGSLTMLRLAAKADLIQRQAALALARQVEATMSPWRAWKPSKRMVNRTLAEIELAHRNQMPE